MADGDLERLVRLYRANLEADDYDEDVSVELIGAIEQLSPEMYQQLKDEVGYDDFMRRAPWLDAPKD